ncbi:DUF2239 family protein [Microbulbifer halophilus]|uniref:DUF2239 family protein n=2 Tax=Microbulbifer halophilus TaxID=453963 RepID=A0ABW5E8W1_9GAMM
MGEKLVARGAIKSVVSACKLELTDDQLPSVLIFDERDSRLVEVDFRGSAADVVRRLDSRRETGAADTGADGPPKKRGRGRPKLGVVAREVTLLPRHWEWLASQPGGASVALRRLVEEARRANSGRDRRRAARESCYRFMVAMAGNRPRFEEASRALFAGERDLYANEIAGWPADIRDHCLRLAEAGFAGDRRSRPE